MLEATNASIQIIPIAGLSAEFEPIGQVSSRRIAAITEIEGPLPANLAFILVAMLRQHSHIGNVLTHISGRNWTKVERALDSIIDPDVGGKALSPLAQNIVELICGDRGVTGRMMKPYFRTVLGKILGIDSASRLMQRISVLFAELECARHQLSNNAQAADQFSIATEST